LDNYLPTIPLYDSPLSPDAWHRVRAPGGYEWWHFDAEDSQHDRRLVAVFYDGYIFDPEYQRRYLRYRRQPTLYAPPLPSEFPCVHFGIYEEKVRAHFRKQFAPSQFRGSPESPALTIGENSVEPSGDALRLTLRDQFLSAQMTFTPKFGDLSYDVEAAIELSGEKIIFHGRGFRDHRFGTEPPSRAVHGRVLLEDAMCAFQISQSPTLIEADASGVRHVEIGAYACDWQSPVPSAIQFDDLLSLLNPQLLDSLPTRAVYDAVWRGREAKALCTIIQSD